MIITRVTSTTFPMLSITLNELKVIFTSIIRDLPSDICFNHVLTVTRRTRIFIYMSFCLCYVYRVYRFLIYLFPNDDFAD